MNRATASQCRPSASATDGGRELEPVLMALCQWGEHAPVSDTTRPDLGVDALILALKGTFTGNYAASRDAVVHLNLDDDHFRLTIKNGQLMAKRAEVDDADTTISTTTTTLQSLVFGERTVADAERSGDITITGDRDTAEHVLRPSQHSRRSTCGTKHDGAVTRSGNAHPKVAPQPRFDLGTRLAWSRGRPPGAGGPSRSAGRASVLRYTRQVADDRHRDRDRADRDQVDRGRGVPESAASPGKEQLLKAAVAAVG
jgi:hypothetical protein